MTSVNRSTKKILRAGQSLRLTRPSHKLTGISQNRGLLTPGGPVLKECSIDGACEIQPYAILFAHMDNPKEE